MLRRSTRSPFAPDAFVFPGGTADPQDADEAIRARTTGLNAARLASEFRATTPESLPHDVAPIGEGDGAALLVAALRELFEEAGVLIARDYDGWEVHVDALADSRIAEERVRVHAGDLSFADFLEGHGWYADANALTFFSHWVTPPSEPRRYNTHFFIAEAPAGQAASADTHETHDGIWIAPSRALQRAREGEFHLVYPTIKHLTRLQAFDSIESLIDYAQSKAILTIVPTGTIADGFAMPADLENVW